MHHKFQHPLSNQTEPESVAKVFELWTRERFHEDVGKVVRAGNVMNRNFIVLDAISNVVITKADMLGSLVELIVLRESDRRLIIGVEWHDNGKIGVDLLEDMAEPQSLLTSIGHRDVFGLGRRECHYRLLLGSPRDRAASEHKSIS